MTDRRPSKERREEAVDAALALLADEPLERLSTRQLARALGVSQPALFRHFRSRDGILLAVVERARSEVGEAVAAALTGDPVGDLRGVVEALLGAVERRPGLPRLLFSLAMPGGGPVRDALLSLASGQRRLLEDLVRRAQRDGALSAEPDPKRAAVHLVGLLQGVIFQWVAGGRRGALLDEAGPLFDLWRAGVGPGELDPPAAGEGAGELDPPAAGEGAIEVPGAAPRLAWVDGVALLGRGVDPLADVLDALEGAGPGSALRLDAPFYPGPLVTLLRSRGMEVAVAPRGDRHELLALVPPVGPPEDLRDLEAPGPLERILLATSSLAPGAVYLARTPRAPRLLLGRLDERGLGAAIHEERDGSALILCWREPT